jgi:hypothetical protein
MTVQNAESSCSPARALPQQVFQIAERPKYGARKTPTQSFASTSIARRLALRAEDMAQKDGLPEKLPPRQSPVRLAPRTTYVDAGRFVCSELLAVFWRRVGRGLTVCWPWVGRGLAVFFPDRNSKNFQPHTDFRRCAHDRTAKIADFTANPGQPTPLLITQKPRPLDASGNRQTEQGARRRPTQSVASTPNRPCGSHLALGGVWRLVGGVWRTRPELSVRRVAFLRADLRRKIACEKSKPLDFPAKHRQTPPNADKYRRLTKASFVPRT